MCRLHPTEPIGISGFYAPFYKLTLKDRTFICEEYGNMIDRDLNAAINIKNEGLRIIGQRLPEFTLVDYPLMNDRLNDEVLRSNGRLKQEDVNLHNV